MPSATSPTLTTAPADLPTVPNPSTFDVLPPFHALLTRLLHPTFASQQTSTPTPQLSSSPSHTTAPLSPKDIATAASGVKIKIQKARIAVQRLPDVERSVKEQEEEIRELQEEARRLRRVLGDLAQAAARAAVETEGNEVLREGV